MDKSETKQLLVMLEQFYPNKKFKDYEAFWGAWSLALGPYAYEDVRGAAAAYAVTNRFFPDVRELVSGLTPIVAPKPVNFGRDDSALMRKLLDNAKAANEVV